MDAKTDVDAKADGAGTDEKTDELRAAHDALAESYAERLAHLLDEMPIERAVLGLFGEFVRNRRGGPRRVGDLGCGTGRLAPFLAAQGLVPRGVDLSPEMIRVARRDHPGIPFDVADLRELPFDDRSLDGVVCWYSLMFLAPGDRSRAFGELARVLEPGGYLATAFKVGDGTLRRAGGSLGPGIEFDVYWYPREEVERRLTEAGFQVVFWAGRPAEPPERQPQAYLIARRT